LHHAQVGDLELNYERLEVVFDTDLIIFTYTADPGTRSADALGLLGSLAATTALTPIIPSGDSTQAHIQRPRAALGYRLDDDGQRCLLAGIESDSGGSSVFAVL
jgi:hypothetical protein